ncbi:sigma-54-dependent transcriptional regulator [Kiloniella sp. b19]|uniref:sigma-54-dependent transcriptional regulator n=1 Tax=Kiloniella sp. GXU_MW_B19 TaxID=3141326 RepID=UPI0031CE3FB7
MSEASPILLIEDTVSLSAVYLAYLAKAGYKADHVETGQAALKALDAGQYSLVLLDLQLPDMNGLDILSRLKDKREQGHLGGLEVVVITSNASVDVAVDSMRLGAYDFLEKPFSAERLIVTIRNALERNRLSKMVKAIQGRTSFHGFVGSSLPMQAVYRMIDAAASSKATVFIMGESGTGKEVCAEAIHKSSQRNDGPFVPINCAAIPRDLMESEIFGHVKGAFTGAVSNREGAAQQAHGGTLFLDEICEMDLDLQSKLLRFVQTGAFQKVGSTKLQNVDIRIVCATNRDPLKEVAEGRFREDLYYRLHVIPINLPPLRERASDVLDIAEYFMSLYAKEEGKAFSVLSAEVKDRFLDYSWPGNIRQLQNVMRNTIVLHQGERIELSMLPVPVGDRASEIAGEGGGPEGGDPGVPGIAGNIGVAGADRSLPGQFVEQGWPFPGEWDTFGQALFLQLFSAEQEELPLWKIERTIIESMIEACDGQVAKAAKRLGVNPSTLYRKKQQWLSENTPEK